MRKFPSWQQEPGLALGLEAGSLWSCIMHQSKSPPVVPTDEQSVYLVVDDFGYMGRCWRETNVEDTDLETVISDLLEGQYNNPVRVVGFNTTENWSRDVSKEIATEISKRCDLQGTEVPANLQEFIERHEVRADRGRVRQV